jgi:hypothetical protein
MESVNRGKSIGMIAAKRWLTVMDEMRSPERQ